jgi:ankyrin repeat protein
VNAEDKDGKTALMVASEKGHKEIVELLKSYGARG